MAKIQYGAKPDIFKYADLPGSAPEVFSLATNRMFVVLWSWRRPREHVTGTWLCVEQCFF